MITLFVCLLYVALFLVALTMIAFFACIASAAGKIFIADIIFLFRKPLCGMCDLVIKGCDWLKEYRIRIRHKA